MYETGGVVCRVDENVVSSRGGGQRGGAESEPSIRNAETRALENHPLSASRRKQECYTEANVAEMKRARAGRGDGGEGGCKGVEGWRTDGNTVETRNGAKRENERGGNGRKPRRRVLRSSTAVCIPAYLGSSRLEKPARPIWAENPAGSRTQERDLDSSSETISAMQSQAGVADVSSRLPSPRRG